MVYDAVTRCSDTRRHVNGGDATSRMKRRQHRAPRIFCPQKIPAIRTPISLVTASDYEVFATRAVTSVINRYYDPTTDEFLSIDPEVAITDEPYVFTNDDPLNAEDPLGLLCLWGCITHGIATGFDDTRHFVATHKVIDGIALGVLSVATGGGALVLAGALEATTVTALSATAVVSGFGANALDERACVNGHSAEACGGFALGLVGSFAGSAGVFGPALGMSSFTQYQVGALSYTAGVISTTYDATVALIHLIPTRKKR